MVGIGIAVLNLLGVFSYAFHKKIISAIFWQYYFYVFTGLISIYLVARFIEDYRLYGMQVLPSLGILVAISVVLFGPTGYILYQLGRTRPHHSDYGKHHPVR